MEPTEPQEEVDPLNEPLPTQVRRGIILTGLSGSGKTTALRILEDQGFYAIDNLPPALLPQLLDVLGGHHSAVTQGIAAVVDVRGEHLLDDLEVVLGTLRRHLDSLTLVFLDASDSALVRRFETTRRKHPVGSDGTPLEGIQRERQLLQRLRSLADVILDTSDLQHHVLRQRLLEDLGLTPASFLVRLSSFGFKYGLPQDADLVFDVRFLPNPNYEPDLCSLSGVDREVQAYLAPLPEMNRFLELAGDLVRFVLPLYRQTGRMRLHLAVGCTGGRHRSVAVAESLHQALLSEGYDVNLCHRDMDKESVG